MSEPIWDHDYRATPSPAPLLEVVYLAGIGVCVGGLMLAALGVVFSVLR